MSQRHQPKPIKYPLTSGKREPYLHPKMPDWERGRDRVYNPAMSPTIQRLEAKLAEIDRATKVS